MVEIPVSIDDNKMVANATILGGMESMVFFFTSVEYYLYYSPCVEMSNLLGSVRPVRSALTIGIVQQEIGCSLFGPPKLLQSSIMQAPEAKFWGTF